MSHEQLSFDKYQEEARKTAIYKDRKNSWYTYPLLGLGGEVGELQQIFKKAIRYEGGVLSEEAVQRIKDEAGDVLWYLTELITSMGGTLNEVARLNLEKLRSRHGEKGA